MANNILKTSLALMLCASPFAAGAHASPVEYLPAASAQLDEMPSAVSVRFNERVDLDASFLRVEGPEGVVSGEPETGTDPRTLATPLSGAEGTYTVKWGVVSADDGHFTRGEYAFSVGVAVAAAAPTFELITLTTRAEAVGMSFELLGNGMLWALIVLFAFAVRPLLSVFSSERPLLERGYLLFGWIGITLAFIGQNLQLFIKSTDLAALQEISFPSAFHSYASTVAGSATLWRGLAIALFAMLFFWGGKKILAATRFTPWEAAMAALLCVFAYFRATVSHAAANPFYPDLSVVINFLHLIEKDAWAGIALALLLAAMTPRLGRFTEAIIPKTSQFLAINLAMVSITGGYIVWLHLGNFENLLSTSWGEAFIPLIVCAVLLVALRVYSIFIRSSLTTLAAECALALLVLYYSSVAILTSPPIPLERGVDLFALVVGAVAAAGLITGFILCAFSPRVVWASAAARQALWSFAGTLAAVAAVLFLLPVAGIHNGFKKDCVADGNQWHFMTPTKAGVPTAGVSREGCMWGMGEYLYHFSDRDEYDRYRSLGEANVEFMRDGSELSFALTDVQGEPAELFVDMEKRLHIIIASRDQSVFAHLHPEDEPSPSVFTARYAFPKAGEYLVTADYAHGVKQYSESFLVTVGEDERQKDILRYPSPGEFGGYSVGLEYGYLESGEVSTLLYSIHKDGRAVENLEPYLGAAMHVSAIKEDLSAFVHAHGEVHDPEAPPQPVVVVDGRVAHNHVPLPASFSSPVEVHLVFPSPGLYTVWGEFSSEGRVIPTAFTVRVE